MKAKVTPDGEIQIPDVLLEQTGLKEGDEVKIEVRGDSLILSKACRAFAESAPRTAMEFLSEVRRLGLETPSEATEWIREWRDLSST